MRSSQYGSYWIVAALLLATAPAYLTPPLAAGESESESMDPAPVPPQASPSGFRLGEPRMFIGGHAGINFPRAGSDLFDMVTRELTLGKSDFRASVVGFDFGLIFRSRYAAVFSMEYSRATAASESRDFVEEDGSAITQTTRFTQLPVTATLRFYPAKMGEHVGSYAWVPARFLPYLGGGGGFLYYDFNQWGHFVDSQTLEIFSADLQSSGFVPTVHVVGGIDIGLSSKILANLEARYSWADAKLSSDFIGFQPIDLAGFRISGGIVFRF